MPWTCDNCETLNQSEVLNCEVCGADRPVKEVWNCPNCETVNAGYAESCEVCGVEKGTADLVPLKPETPKGLVVAGEIKRALWEVPGPLKYEATERVPVPKSLRTDDPVDKIVVNPLRKIYSKFMRLPATGKKKWIRGAVVAAGVGMFAFGAPGWLTFFLIFAGWNWIRYSTTKKFRAKVDRWLESKDIDDGEYRTVKRLVEHFEEGHHFAIESLTFSSMDNKLGSLDRGGYFQQWMVESGERKRGGKLMEAKFQKAVLGEKGIYTLELGQQIIVYGPGKDFKKDATAIRKKTLTMPAPAGPDSPLVLSPRQGYLGIGTTSGVVFIWDVRTFSQNMYSGEMAGQIMALEIFNGERHFVAGTQRGQVVCWGIESRTMEFLDIRMGREVRAVAASPAGSLFAASYDDGEVRVWNWRSNREKMRVNLAGLGDEDAGAEFAHKMAFISGSEDLLTVDHAGNIHRWDVENDPTGPIKTYTAKGDIIKAIAVSPDGKWLAAGSQGGELSLFDLNT